MSETQDNNEAYSKRFSTDAVFRRFVLCTSQLCIDLCRALQLPLTVCTTSLYFIQKFLQEFDTAELESCVLCCSCVLLGWKCCEDTEDSRSVRKLTDICEKLFNLLHKSKDDYADYKEFLVLQAGKRKTVGSHSFIISEENRKLTQDVVTTKNTEELKTDSIDDLIRDFREIFSENKYGGLTSSDWIRRDGGREIILFKEKLKVYESCLLRCLHYEVKPVEATKELIYSFCKFLWIAELEERKQKKENSEKGGCVAQITANSLDNNSSENSCCSQSPKSDLKLLQNLFQLSSAFVIDLYRSPFCLRFSGKSIIVVAIWKASVALAFSVVFKILFNEPKVQEKGSEYNCSSYAMPKLVYDCVRPMEYKEILDKYREVYTWLLEVEIAKHHDIEYEVKSSLQEKKD